jgi:hypothetical protein
MFMKKRVSKITLSLATMLIMSALSVPASAAQNVSVSVDGENVQLDNAPVIENNRTLVPFRAVLEKIGAEVLWDANTKTVTCTLDGNSVSIEIGADNMTVNGTAVALDVPAKIIASRTYVPLRAISEGLGTQVTWDADTKTVEITTNNENASDTSVDLTDNDTEELTFTHSFTKHSNPIQSGSKTIVNVDASYPVFKGNGRAIRTINAYIKSDAEGRTAAYKQSNTKRLNSLYQKTYAGVGDRATFKEYYYTLDYKVKNEDNGIISLYATVDINSDLGKESSVFCLNFDTKTGKLLTAESLLENAEELVKAELTSEGYSNRAVSSYELDDEKYYVSGNSIIFVVDQQTITEKPIELTYALPKREAYTAVDDALNVSVTKVTDTTMVYSQNDVAVMELSSSRPKFSGRNDNLNKLNSQIAEIEADEVKAYKDEFSDEAKAAYKAFRETNTDTKNRFERWLRTTSYEVKYNNGELASVVKSTYVFKGDGNESTTYTAYMCDLVNGKIVEVDTLISDVAKTDSLARAAFKELISASPLSFRTDVYNRFDLSRASKYITEDGVVYMFNPGELASVSKGIISVTVPME